MCTKRVNGIIITLIIMLMNMPIHAQNHDLALAHQYIANNQPDSAVPIYQEGYLLNPDAIYGDYINALILSKRYKDAEKIIQDRMNANQDVVFNIDLGKVYRLEGKDKKANESFEEAMKKINGDDVVTQRLAKAFIDAGLYDYAIKVYLRATEFYHNPYIYCTQLSDLYYKTGKLDLAIDELLQGMLRAALNIEIAKNKMLDILGDDPEKLKTAQKAVVNMMNEHPEFNSYAELMVWIYTQKNDWDGALMQMEALDEMNKEDGRRLLGFAHSAVLSEQYETACKAYDDIIAKGPAMPLYTLAISEKLSTALAKIKNEPTFTTDEVNNLVSGYDTMMRQFPALYATQTASDYASLCADYAGNAEKAIEILQTAIARPDIKRNLVGQFKLQMGDCYLLDGKIWDASLTYSQVDKEFKQDPMGEDARFRNAKLAYYRGDFLIAQQLLTILKSATSELIANDALYLSVLITENTPDSNYYPLERYAHADLLLQQNKFKEAETLLDSLNKAFPKHALNDDILMLRSSISLKRRDYAGAINYLQEIYHQYGTDVLGDDAVYKMAEIYQNNLHNNDSAKHYYEQLIIDYPGSTFVQTARQRLHDLTSGTNP